MSIPDIEAIRKLSDFGVTHQWSFEFIQPPVGLTFAESFNPQCKSVDVPKSATPMDSVTLKGVKVNQPKVIDYGNKCKIVFVETAGQEVTKAFKQWRDLIQKVTAGVPNGQQGSKTSVQCDIQLTRMNRQSEAKYYYKLIGCFLEDLTPANMESESKIQEVTVNLAFDYFKEGDAP